MYQILIQRASSEPGPNNTNIRKWANHILKKQIKAAELTIRLVNEDEITFLNKTYRHKDKPTNVLSFPFQSQPELALDPPLIGDVIICNEVVNQEATKQHIENAAHWAHIIMHGILHLLGHNHEEEHEAQVMEQIEIESLAELGFPNPYEPVEGNANE